MGSLRNPVGPLPSTIYWRRRAVAASLIALLAALALWAVISGGGNGKKTGASPGGSSPTPSSITPGPSGSGPAISAQPGGRDESGGSGDSGNGSGNGGTGTGPGGGSDGANGDTAPGGGGGADGAGNAGTGAGRQVPADSPIPTCVPAALQLTLRTKVSYSPDQKPTFQLIAQNVSKSTCKADFGPRNAVLTVTEAGGADKLVWSSKDCPRAAGGVLLSIPAGETAVHIVEWDRTRSSPQCATPPTGTAGPGTYLVEVNAPGVPVQRASFVLAKD
ncbi:hypothetical protein [Streptomyces sp. DT171]|uniref:hypothetical protein n=1 Tax=Streptomyces sp. DT171 TaxID=3416524 RepID=UPI003CFADF30